MESIIAEIKTAYTSAKDNAERAELEAALYSAYLHAGQSDHYADCAVSDMIEGR